MKCDVRSRGPSSVSGRLRSGGGARAARLGLRVRGSQIDSKVHDGARARVCACLLLTTRSLLTHLQVC